MATRRARPRSITQAPETRSPSPYGRARNTGRSLPCRWSRNWTAAFVSVPRNRETSSAGGSRAPTVRLCPVRWSESRAMAPSGFRRSEPTRRGATKCRFSGTGLTRHGQQNGYMPGSFGQRRPNGPGEPLELRAGERETRGRRAVALWRLTGRVVDARANLWKARCRRSRFASWRGSAGCGRRCPGNRANRRSRCLSAVPSAPGQVHRRRVGRADLSGTRQRGAVVQQAMTTGPATAYLLPGQPIREPNAFLWGWRSRCRASTSRWRRTHRADRGHHRGRRRRSRAEGVILTPSRRSGVVATPPVGARIDAAGRFEFPNVPPGES